MAQVALSTMWGVGRFPALADFFSSGQKLGFQSFELNHMVDSPMLQGLDLTNGFRIASVHEPCPADVSTGTLKNRDWLISAADEENRRQGIAMVKRSIDLAHAVGARIIIVHPGRVTIDAGVESRLYALYREGKQRTTEYDELKVKLAERRAAQAEVNVAAVCKSLPELAEYAHRFDIRLGLENRFHYHEIPLPDELDRLLGIGYEDVIGYWHDVGHAQVLENLGFGTHREWLERFAPRIVGTHFHDVVGIGDHRAAGSGQMDWDMVARYIPAAAYRTCEFQNNNSPEQVARGVQFVVDKGLVKSDAP